MWRAISWSCRRSFTSIGWKSRQVLTRFARHYETGEPMPKPLLDKLLAARNFGQGFATVEFLASALIDMDFHTQPPPADPMAAQAADAWRASACRDEIAPRHAAPHFTHVFGGDGYSRRLLRLSVVGSAGCRRLQGLSRKRMIPSIPPPRSGC